MSNQPISNMLPAGLQDAGCFDDLPLGWQPPALQLQPPNAADAAAGQLPQLPGLVPQPPIAQPPSGSAVAPSLWQQHAQPLFPCRQLSTSLPSCEAACPPPSATCHSLPISSPGEPVAATRPPPAPQHHLQTHSMPELPALDALPCTTTAAGSPRTAVDRLLEETHDWWVVSSVLC
jgi:hypothetical protein